MAEQVVDAIKQGNNLQLGCLVGQNPYSAIFIGNSHKNHMFLLLGVRLVQTLNKRRERSTNTFHWK